MGNRNVHKRDYTILYFEDDPISLEDYYRALTKICNVEFGAHEELIKKHRDQPIALLILDIMIHTQGVDPASLKSNERVLIDNITYSGDKEAWKLTGLEFLQRVRNGEYERYGIPHNVPVIVYSAVIEESIKRLADGLGIVAYLEKPVTVSQLKERVMSTLGMPLQGDI